jgi:hypothetical protein
MSWRDVPLPWCVARVWLHFSMKRKFKRIGRELAQTIPTL